MTGKGVVSLNPPYDPNAWMACDYPERPWDIGTSFHLRSSDNCRPCAIAWLVARTGCVEDDVTNELTERAMRTLGGAA